MLMPTYLFHNYIVTCNSVDGEIKTMELHILAALGWSIFQIGSEAPETRKKQNDLKTDQVQRVK